MEGLRMEKMKATRLPMVDLNDFSLAYGIDGKG